MQPTRVWRTVRGEAANYKVAYYTTQESRDVAAQRDADKDGEPVMCEMWTQEISDRCDPINDGWGMDKLVEPSGSA